MEGKRVHGVRERVSNFSNHIKNSGRSIRHVRKTIRDYSLNREIAEYRGRFDENFRPFPQVADEQFRADKYLRTIIETQKSRQHLPSAQELRALAEKPMVKERIRNVHYDFYVEELERVKEVTNEYRNTLRYYADKIQEADKSGQPLKLTEVQMDELNKAEHMLSYYTYNPTIYRDNLLTKSLNDLRRRQNARKHSLPTAENIRKMVEKPLVKSRIPSKGYEHEDVIKMLNEARDTLKHYADEIQKADKLHQPLNFTKTQIDHFNINEEIWHRFTYKPNILRSKLQHIL